MSKKSEFYRIEHLQICQEYHKYFFPTGSRISNCSIWQNSVSFETPCRNTKSQLKNAENKNGVNLSFDFHVTSELVTEAMSSNKRLLSRSLSSVWMAAVGSRWHRSKTTSPPPPISYFHCNNFFDFIFTGSFCCVTFSFIELCPKYDLENNK